jgi:hypothetical protein
VTRTPTRARFSSARGRGVTPKGDDDGRAPAGETKDATVPGPFQRPGCKIRQSDAGVTEFVEVPGRGHVIPPATSTVVDSPGADGSRRGG